MLACLLPDLPTGNSLGVLTPADPRAPLRQLAALAAVLASLPFDGALRLRVGDIVQRISVGEVSLRRRPVSASGPAS